MASGRRLVSLFWADAAPVFALSGIAIAQPVLDLFGRNPEYFVAADLARPDIVLYALVVALLVPAVAGATVVGARRLLGDPVADPLRSLALGGLAAVFGLNLARSLGVDGVLPAGGLALVVGLAVVGAERRWSTARLMLRYLGAAPFAFVALFLLASPSSRLIWESGTSAAADVRIVRPAPVVWVMLDEVPVASLLDEDLNVDGELFPAFARLAAEGTWYRNATSVAPFTVNAVPSALTGLLPTGEREIPNAIDHPQSLFTLLGGSYELEVTETITQVCPAAVCDPDAPARDLRALGSGLRQALDDTLVVFGHTTLPADLRDDLPALDEGWAGFVDGPTDDGPTDDGTVSRAPSEGLSEFLARRRSERAAGFPDLRGATLADAVDALEVDTGTDPLLFYAHEVFPHFPWERTQSGARYRGELGPPGGENRRWGDDEFLIRQGYQRHLLQLGYADTVLGALFDRLDEGGLWDDAVVVVTADHGISFRADDLKRSPTVENAQEVYRVPLFIKAPGQTSGVVDDRVAQTIDVLPTLVDLLDIEVDWDFDGRSLADEPPATDPRPEIVYKSGPDTIDGGIDEIRSIVARNHERLPTDGGWASLARVGRYGPLVGQAVDTLDQGPAAPWSARLGRPDDFVDLRPEVEPIPLILKASVTEGRSLPDEVLVAIDGVIAGVGGFQPDDGAMVLRALLEETLLTAGTHEVQLFEPTGTVGDVVLHPVTLGP